MTDGIKEFGRPWIDSHSPLWKLPTRKIRREGCHVCRMGARLGSSASGASANVAKSGTKSPPPLGETALWKLLKLLHAPAPSMNADASLGFARTAYQSATAAMNLREAGKFALVRFAGTTSRAHTASRQDIAQRAKVGNCPCCAQATHVAFPPRYALGGFYHSESRGLALR